MQPQVDTEYGYTYTPYPSEKSSERAEYDFFATRMTEENFLADLNRKFMILQDMASRVIRFEDEKGGRIFGIPSLDLEIPKLFYRYAADGIPEFVMEGDEYLEKHMWNGHSYSFSYEWDSFEAYNLLNAGLNEVAGGGYSFAMDVILNKFVARLKLDSAIYDGAHDWLSIPEVALLAGMKDKSVRNAAHKEIGAVSNARSGMTLIRSDKALSWLMGRRKFIPSLKLESKRSIEALFDIRANFGG